MKVAELIKLFSLSTRYKLIGAKTGKTLYKSWVNKNLDKFKDLEVTEPSIVASFQVQSGGLIMIISMVLGWVII